METSCGFKSRLPHQHTRARRDGIPRTLGKRESLSIRVVPLRGWEELSASDRHSRHRVLTDDARADAHAARDGKSYLGTAAILQQDPQQRPSTPKRSPRVRCFASTATARREYRKRYNDFVEALRESYSNLLDAWRELGQRTFCLPGFANPSTAG